MADHHDVVVVGTSAGGVEALTTLVAGLPPDLPASLFVVLHMTAGATSVLPAILNRAGPLPAQHPVDCQAIQPGRIYVAPPDRHLLIEDGHIRLVHGPRENGHRPAIDALFRAAARAYGRRVVGVVLTGNLDDGTAGMVAIKRMGGLAVVQDPDDAVYPDMPRSAADAVDVDYCLPLGRIAPTLIALASQPTPPDDAPVPPDLDLEARMAAMDTAAMSGEDRPGVPSHFACPDCGGVLREVKDGEVEHFRCRVGHAYSPESLHVGQAQVVEEALWRALEALEDQASLAKRIARRATTLGHLERADRYRGDALQARASSSVLRQVLRTALHPDPPEEWVADAEARAEAANVPPAADEVS